MSYNSKYKSSEIEAILDSVEGKQDEITDLATIRSGAAKGATALQSEQYKGTITGVSANGTSVATSGVANIPAASTSAYGVTKLSSATNSTSTSLAATASAVKAAYDLANNYKGTVTGVKINGTTKNPSSGVVDLGTVITSHQDISGKQDKLVSGTNIKTINGTSLLGSGNITISGGGGSSSGSGAYSEVNHGTSDTTFALTPNTFHVWEEVSALTLTLGSETAGVANEFLFQFNSGSEATTLTMSDDIKWTEELAIESNRIYQVSILKGLASVLSWKVEPSIVFPITLEMGDNGDIGISLYSYLQSTYGEPTSGTTLNEEIINNYNGVTFQTIEYATYMGFTGYWLNGYAPYMMSWVLLEDGYLQRVLPAQEN